MKTQSDSDDAVLRKALSRGAMLKENLVNSAGGLVGSKQVAGILGISTQGLRELPYRQTLMAVEFEGALGYPAFQFESEAMRAGVAIILDAIGVDDAWGRLSFMFLELDQLGGKTPIEAIRSGATAAVALAARHFGEHGAG